MSQDNRTKISEYIMEYKDTNEIHKVYREFEFDWLKSFDEELVDKVRTEFDCVRNERIYGDGEDNEMVINDFIKSLEDLLNA